MKRFALGKIAEKKPWFVIDFCQLGFIGKMFKSIELPWLVNFFLMFYNDKPGENVQLFNKSFRFNLMSISNNGKKFSSYLKVSINFTMKVSLSYILSI